LALERAGDAQRAVMARPGMDLAADTDESFYARQYLHWLRPHLNGQTRVLDIGCGAGRLTAPVASVLTGAAITGVDLSAGKLEYARMHVSHLPNVELVHADAADWLTTIERGTVDLVLFTEVDFFASDDRLLAQTCRALRPGGLLFASFRTRWHNLAHSVRVRDFASARHVRDDRAGLLWGTPYRFRWYTGGEIIETLEVAGFSVDGLHGIGVLSGREHDPLDVLARPAELTASEREALLELEISLATPYAECGRYIAAIARKKRPG
jgi:SAM-dependent methyltransferase